MNTGYVLFGVFTMLSFKITSSELFALRLHGNVPGTK